MLSNWDTAGANRASIDCSRLAPHHVRYAKRPSGSWRSYPKPLRTSRSKKRWSYDEGWPKSSTNEGRISWICGLTTTTSKKSRTSVSGFAIDCIGQSLDSTAAFNLINDIDVAQTEARIQAYRAENAALIEFNIQREEQSAQALKEQEEYDRKLREQRTLDIRREEDEEREDREKRERELIDKLETSTKDASKLVAKSRAEAQKRTAARTATTFQSTSSLLRSRAAQSTVKPDLPHIPLEDNWDDYTDKYEVQTNYYDPMSEPVRKDKEGIMRAGGYRIEEAWERALRSAVAGLDLLPLVGFGSEIEPDGDVVMASA